MIRNFQCPQVLTFQCLQFQTKSVDKFCSTRLFRHIIRSVFFSSGKLNLVTYLFFSLPKKKIIVFDWLKIHFHCKVKRPFSYNLRRKYGQCTSGIRLHFLCSLTLIYTVHKKPLYRQQWGKG